MGKLTGFVELLLVFGGLLAVLVWELVSLKLGERAEKANAEVEIEPGSRAAGHAEGQHGLHER